MPAYFISYFSPMLGLLTGLFVLKGMEPQQFAYSDMFRRRPN
jgi:hypothetical protein